jgi:hypothetical protein
MNTRVLLLGCLLAVSCLVQASTREMWVWKDANGVTQYSDRPVPGAKRVEISAAAPTAEAAPAPGATTATAASKGDSPSVQYDSLEIWQPENGESFFGTDATVTVRMRSEPALAAGDRLLLYVDGKLIEEAINSYDHTLGGLERGVHSMSAVILDDKGTEKIRSEPRVFHIRQSSVNPPQAVGPSLRPQPPPPPAPKPGSPK